MPKSFKMTKSFVGTVDGINFFSVHDPFSTQGMHSTLSQATEKIPYQGHGPEDRVTHLERALAEAKQEAEAQRISAEIKAANEAKVTSRRALIVHLTDKSIATRVLLGEIERVERLDAPVGSGTFLSSTAKDHLADMRALSKSLGYGIVVTASGALSLVRL